MISIQPYADEISEPVEYIETTLIGGDGYETIANAVSAKIAIRDNPVIGNVDDLNGMTLADAILALRIAGGMALSEKISLAADVNEDGRIGVEEAVYE